MNVTTITGSDEEATNEAPSKMSPAPLRKSPWVDVSTKFCNLPFRLAQSGVLKKTYTMDPNQDRQLLLGVYTGRPVDVHVQAVLAILERALDVHEIGVARLLDADGAVGCRIPCPVQRRRPSNCREPQVSHWLGRVVDSVPHIDWLRERVSGRRRVEGRPDERAVGGDVDGEKV